MAALNLIIFLSGGKARAAVIAALLIALITVSTSNWLRGIEIDRMESANALIEQAATMRQDEFKRATERLAEVRSTDNLARDSIIRGIRNEGDTVLPNAIVDALDGLCHAGAPCSYPK